jgi:hypothetical protein
VRSQSPDAIREAVRRCLERVKDGSTPLGVIAEYLAQLRDAGWDEESIHAVDAAVRQVLMGMLDVDNGQTPQQ